MPNDAVHEEHTDANAF
ncbi:hypothetical protein [Bartonella quintana]|nr:hypothetical protein [Bartonella quintana]